MQDWTFISNDGEVMQIMADNYTDAMNALLSILGWGLEDNDLILDEEEDSL